MRRFFARLAKLFTRGRSRPADVAQAEAPAKTPEATLEPQPAAAPAAALERLDDVVPKEPPNAPDVLPDVSTDVLPEAPTVAQNVLPAEAVEDPTRSAPIDTSRALATASEGESEGDAGAPLAEPMPPPERDMVRYADYSDIRYDAVAGGFPDPPGLGAEVDAAPTAMPEMTSLTTTLPLALLDETLVELSAGRARVEDVLGAEPFSVGWPRSAADGPRFEIPRPDERFRDSTGDVRTLKSALPDGELTDALDRLELIRLLCIGLHALHAAEMVTGGVSIEAYAFTVEPRPALVLLKPDLLRCIGASSWLPMRGPGAAASTRIDSSSLWWLTNFWSAGAPTPGSMAWTRFGLTGSGPGSAGGWGGCGHEPPESRARAPRWQSGWRCCCHDAT